MGRDNFRGVLYGRTLIQERGSIGGSKSVFVPMQGTRNQYVYPTFGGRLKNPFKGRAKIFAGDLFEVRMNDDGVKPEIYILKTFKVKSATGTTVKIYRDGYKHIPFAGDILMVAPADIGTAGTGVTVQAVTKEKDGVDDVWTLTTSSEVTASDGTILVEATTDGASAKMVVQTINAVAPYDYDFMYEPVADPAADDDEQFEAARYFIAPALGGTMYKNKMSPIPACVEVFNHANMNGWFEVSYRKV